MVEADKAKKPPAPVHKPAHDPDDMLADFEMSHKRAATAMGKNVHGTARHTIPAEIPGAPLGDPTADLLMDLVLDEGDARSSPPTPIIISESARLNEYEKVLAICADRLAEASSNPSMGTSPYAQLSEIGGIMLKYTFSFDVLFSLCLFVVNN
jgi:hypothetical protein